MRLLDFMVRTWRVVATYVTTVNYKPVHNWEERLSQR
jgi:hypothetical protein